MKIKCTTLFDITFTGITGNYKPSQIPLWDRSGTTITDQQSWARARNQQRNWETVIQLIGLRTQVTIEPPFQHNNQWTFTFEIDSADMFDDGNDALGTLKSDCVNVPMLTGLRESADVGNLLIPNQNIWFEPINNL